MPSDQDAFAQQNQKFKSNQKACLNIQASQLLASQMAIDIYDETMSQIY